MGGVDATQRDPHVNSSWEMQQAFEMLYTKASSRFFETLHWSYALGSKMGMKHQQRPLWFGSSWVGGQRKSLGSPGVTGRQASAKACGKQARTRGQGHLGWGGEGLHVTKERERRMLTWPSMSNASLRSKTSNAMQTAVVLFALHTLLSTWNVARSHWDVWCEV